MHPLSIATLQNGAGEAESLQLQARRLSATQCCGISGPAGWWKSARCPQVVVARQRFPSSSAIRCTAVTMAPFISSEAMLHCQFEAMADSGDVLWS